MKKTIITHDLSTGQTVEREATETDNLIPTPMTMDDVRTKRDAKINETSWIVERHRDQRDSGVEPNLTENQYQAWLIYRQALRDLPETQTDPLNIVWPVPPT